MIQSPQAVSPLRQRMLDDMRMRQLTPQTQAGYLRAVTKFARHFDRSPGLASAEDLRAYQLHLVERGVRWRRPSRAMARRRSSTPIKARSSRAATGSRCCKTPRFKSAWMAKGVGLITCSLSGGGAV